MKKFFLFSAAALIAASAAAQELVYEIDYSKENWNFYVMGYEPKVVDGILTSENPLNEEGGPAWYQYFIADHFRTVEGETYTAVVTCKASEESTMNLNLGWGWGEGQQMGQPITMSTEWTEVKLKYENVGAPAEGASSNLILQPGVCMATIEIKDVKLYHGDAPESGDAPSTAEWVSIIEGGNAEDGETPSIQAGWNGPAKLVANPSGEGLVFECPIAADPKNPWDSQLFIVFNEALKAGANIRVSFDYYCTDERSVETQAQGNPGEYHHWACIGILSAGPTWQKHTAEVEVTSEFVGDNGFKTIAFNLASAPEAATFYINNVVVEMEETGETPDDPVTPGDENVIASFFDGTGATFGGWGGTIEQVEEDGKPCLKYTNEEAKNFWETQIAIDLNYEIGETYYFSFDVKGTGTEEISSGFQYAGLNNAGEQVYWGCGNCTGFKATPNWTNIVIKGTAVAAEEGQAPGRWVANLGQYVGELYLTNVKVYTMGTATAVEAIAPVKINTAVYNLQGVKVANSIDEVAAPGLYISNGKKVIKK